MVGIVSCYFYPNFGSMLQSFATQLFLDKLGIENETICIDGIKSETQRRIRNYLLKSIFDVHMYHAYKGFAYHHLKMKVDSKFNADIVTRKKSLNEFSKTHFRLSEACSSKNQLSDYCQKYNSIVLGSDQLWRPSNIAADYYTLNFVPKYINKVTYATSFGLKSLPHNLHETARSFLNRIEHISVREPSGQRIIEELTGRKVPVVCDPSLLIEKEDWLRSLEYDKAKIFESPYIFCYFLGNNKSSREFANELKRKTGCQIVAMRHVDEYLGYENNFGDFAPYDISPSDFVHLINNAEFVCTDSFHGTAFSIIMKKNFFSFRRFKKETRESTNNRIENLLGRVGLVNRLMDTTEDPTCVSEDIDYSGVTLCLESWRKESMDYLKKALGVDKSND